MTKRDDRQLDLFARAQAAEPASPPAPRRDPTLVALAEALPAHLRLGTSSWTFPGWAGLVYHDTYPSQKAFTQRSLAEYARFPLFRTVGIDRSHYAPLDAPTLAAYGAQLPAGFRCVSKAWDELTTMVFPDHERYGARRGQINPSFLDPEHFRDVVAAPLLDAFADHVGPVVLELAPMRRPPPPRELEAKLEAFLARAPAALHYAVELRNRELFTPRYRSILKHFAASHVLNYWTGMPTLGEQMRMSDALAGPATVVRLMLPPYTAYQQRKRDFSPFDRLLDPQPSMHDDVQILIDRAGELGHTLFIIANNKAEGSAPLTLRTIAERWMSRTKGTR